MRKARPREVRDSLQCHGVRTVYSWDQQWQLPSVRKLVCEQTVRVGQTALQTGSSHPITTTTLAHNRVSVKNVHMCQLI